MDFKIIFRYKQSRMWSLGFLASLLLLVISTGDFKTTVTKKISLRSEILQSSFNTADILFHQNDLLRQTTSSVRGKVTSYRKKFKHLIEGNDDHSPYVKELQYIRYLNSFVKLNYESPYFVSEQLSFLYRLSVF
ncbi:hypothetical protein [Pedobacter cryoconitis]|nr:hypothetical protein [Pedobacter cryoconitis]